KAAELMGKRYTLVITNVPFLTSSKHGEVVASFLDRNYPQSKTDLATAFLERCMAYCNDDGTVALVTPQNWHFLGSYKKMRERLLQDATWNIVVKLGPAAF